MIATMEVEMPSQSHRPLVTSMEDISIGAVIMADQYEYHSFYLLIDDKVWHGQLAKRNPTDWPTIDEINQQLQQVEETSIWPEKPASIRAASALIPDVYIKRPNFNLLDDENDPDCIKKVLLHEASIMEQIPSHPNIVTYYGCRVDHHGRITGIVLEHLEKTLGKTPLDVLDIPTFLAELQSAVDYLHSLNLAHNDINPNNIMVKNKKPVLIDFGGCAPLGERIEFGGTFGWVEAPIDYSEAKNDLYAMKKLQEWFENGGKLQESERDREYLAALTLGNAKHLSITKPIESREGMRSRTITSRGQNL